MSSIHCCGAKRASRSFVLEPQSGFLYVQMSILDECPVCNHFVVELFRIDYNHELSSVRKINKQGRKFFEKLSSSILYEHRASDKLFRSYGSFYLSYSEFGKVKRCYSNLSTLKIGLFDNDKWLYPQLRAKLQ